MAKYSVVTHIIKHFFEVLIYDIAQMNLANRLCESTCNKISHAVLFNFHKRFIIGKSIVIESKLVFA